MIWLTSFRPGPVQGIKNVTEVCITGDDVDRATGTQYPFCFPDPLQGEFTVLLLRDLDIAINYEFLIAVVVLVERVTIDTIRRISDDEIN